MIKLDLTAGLPEVQDPGQHHQVLHAGRVHRIPQRHRGAAPQHARGGDQARQAILRVHEGQGRHRHHDPEGQGQAQVGERRA